MKKEKRENLNKKHPMKKFISLFRKKYYVSHYEGCAYYHPEEGGYYEEGLNLVEVLEFNNVKEVSNLFKSILGEKPHFTWYPANLPTVDDNYDFSAYYGDEYTPINKVDKKGNINRTIVGVEAHGKYIGDDDIYILESKKERGCREIGYHPYE